MLLWRCGRVFWLLASNCACQAIVGSVGPLSTGLREHDHDAVVKISLAVFSERHERAVRIRPRITHRWQRKGRFVQIGRARPRVR